MWQPPEGDAWDGKEGRVRVLAQARLRVDTIAVNQRLGQLPSHSQLLQERPRLAGPWECPQSFDSW